MVKVAPSLLSANFAYLKEEINAIKAADWIHYDVMDGHFVPNISFGYSILKDVSKVTDMYLDVHLMITDPAKYVDNFINSNASLIVFHYEAVAEDKINELIAHIKEHDVEVLVGKNLIRQLLIKLHSWQHSEKKIIIII